MKFSNLSDWAVDPALEQQGVIIDLGRGRTLTIRRAGGSNRAYQVKLGELASRHRGPHGTLTLEEAEAENLMIEAYAETVVIGWQGIEADGQPLRFAPANCAQLLRAFPEIWRRVREEAEKVANFRASELEADADVLGKP